MIFDTHAHYDEEAFDEDRDALLAGMPEAGVTGIVNMAASLEGARASAELARKYDHIYAGIGLHPDHAGLLVSPERRRAGNRAGDAAGASGTEAGAPGTEAGASGPDAGAPGSDASAQDPAKAAGSAAVQDLHPDDVCQELLNLCRMEKTVAFGEIGLDYHWDVETREVQQETFALQLELAKEAGLPINVHSREASQDSFDLIRKHHAGSTGGIIHCYSGSVEMAREYVKMGYMIGIGGVVTFKNAKTLQKVAAAIPLESIVTETDCPYMAPEPHRGTRNDSRNIRYVIRKIAQIREMDPEEAARQLYENAKRVYRIM